MESTAEEKSQKVLDLLTKKSMNDLPDNAEERILDTVFGKKENDQKVGHLGWISYDQWWITNQIRAE